MTEVTEEDTKAADALVSKSDGGGEGPYYLLNLKELAQFRATARAEERERCARRADQMIMGKVTLEDYSMGYLAGTKDTAKAIRLLK